MRLFLLSSFSSPHLSPPPPPPPPQLPSPSLTRLTFYISSALFSANSGNDDSNSIANTPTGNDKSESNNPGTRAFRNGVSIILSFGLLFSSPLPSLSSVALFSSPLPLATQSSPSVSFTDPRPSCREAAAEETMNTSQAVTNDSIVEEAWQIVYDSFLDTTIRHRWSPETWLQKKEDILGTSIQTRSKAHDIIRRMLANLGDPYTRFLTPVEVSWPPGRVLTEFKSFKSVIWCSLVGKGIQNLHYNLLFKISKC